MGRLVRDGVGIRDIGDASAVPCDLARERRSEGTGAGPPGPTEQHRRGHSDKGRVPDLAQPLQLRVPADEAGRVGRLVQTGRHCAGAQNSCREGRVVGEDPCLDSA